MSHFDLPWSPFLTRQERIALVIVFIVLVLVFVR